MKSVLLINFLLFLASSVTAQTADDIVQHNIASRGGLHHIENVTSIQMSGIANMNGNTAPFIIMMERPGKLRIELIMRRDTIVQAYDGHEGWAKLPRSNGSMIRQMTPSEINSLKDQADFDGPLVHYRQKKNEITLLGEARIDSVDAYKLAVKKPDGDKVVMFISMKTYHIIREVTQKKVAGSNPISSSLATIQTNYDDFRETQGLVLPYAIETVVDGRKISRLLIDHIEVNPGFPDSLFERPAG